VCGERSQAETWRAMSVIQKTQDNDAHRNMTNGVYKKGERRKEKNKKNLTLRLK
jgi:hypothetical protein